MARPFAMYYLSYCKYHEDLANQNSQLQGDSGGPLVYTDGARPEIIGVSSFGSADNCLETPSVFGDIRGK